MGPKTFIRNIFSLKRVNVKTNCEAELITNPCMVREGTDRQTDRQGERQTKGERERQREGGRQTQTDRQTEAERTA